MSVEIKENTIDDLYDPETDDPPYDDLLETGIVLDKNGKVELDPPSDDELKIIYPSKAGSVLSGKGTFGAFKSNLQKAVRRCNVRQVVFSVVESCSLGGSFCSNIVNRLCKVIISEDIGVAEPLLAIKVADFFHYFNAKHINTGRTASGLPLCDELKLKLLQLATEFANARKSRLVCNLLCYLGPKGTAYDNFGDAYNAFTINIKLLKLESTVLTILACSRLAGLNKSYFKIIFKDNWQDKLSKKRYRHQLYILWNYLFSLNSDYQVNRVNQALFSMYKHNDEESIMLIIHAALNCIFYKDGFPEENDDKKEKEIKCIYQWDKIEKWNNINIMSVSYDMHVGGVRSLIPERCTPDFFWKYGAKIANRNSLFEEYDDTYYNLNIERINNQ